MPEDSPQPPAPSRQPPIFMRWQGHLADDMGEVEAAALMSRVQARYDDLYAHRKHYENRALRKHQENTILPSLALYQVLREDGLDEETALMRIRDLLILKVLPGRRQLEFFGRLPLIFTLFRLGTKLKMQRVFPEEGWDIEWLEVSSERVAFNVHRCFWLEVLADYDATELVAQSCYTDDVLFDGASPYISWERTQTLARGGELCDFCFRHARPGR